MANKTRFTDYDYDLIVIGGGSGGLAASKEAVECGAEKVAVFDYVTPTVHGTKWGLGGTCVNVGCVPKKLMHYAASLGPKVKHDAHKFGWNISDSASHDWNKMIQTIQTHVRSLAFSYRVGLRKAGVEYINALAHLEGPHEVGYTDKNGQNKVLSTKYILIAVGGRPYVPPEDEVPGATRYAITSDDLFSWKNPPGKTLVVGASYIALECAGALTELGYATTVAIRSVPLRMFDRQCAEKVKQLMEESGTQFIYDLPKEIIKEPNGQLRVNFKSSENNQVYDTVLYAVGRRAETRYLNLEKHGVRLNHLGHIVVNNEQSSVPSIYAIGDVIADKPELTPVAIRAGELLARRLFSRSQVTMDYKFVPTTIFTPYEYGCCGYSEEQAIEEFGAETIEVFLYEYTSLELAACHREKHSSTMQNEADTQLSPNALAKLICIKSENNKVIGFHYVGLNAGEITQGFSVCLKMGATKSDIDATIGIHPTDAEAFQSLNITKRSGVSWVATGGCGGGKCG